MTARLLQLNIVTPLGTVYEGEVSQVTATTTSGEITILVDHIPLITTLAVGHIMIRTNQDEQRYFAINGGVLEKRHDNTVVVLSTRSESAEEIDKERAEAAYKNAEELMAGMDKNAQFNDYSNLQEVLNKELNRVRIGQKGGRR